MASAYGYDEWLIGRFLHYVPEVELFLQTMEKKPLRYIRVNTLKTDSKELVARLENKGFQLRQTFIKEVFLVSALSSRLSLGATTEYMLGHYYIQDLSSCVATEAIGAQNNDLVLDLGAAPGGKTTFMAQRMENTGSILALEPNHKRARSLRFNLDRCGVCNACIVEERAESLLDSWKIADASLERKFDRVLLDAPCSCEGVIPRTPSRKTSHTPADVDYCSNRQRELISVAADFVKEGGILLYSTCSFAPEENEMIVDHLIKKHEPNDADMFNEENKTDYIKTRESGITESPRKITVEPLYFGTPGMTEFGGTTFNKNISNTRRLYPHLDSTLGFYVAKLRIW